MYACIYHDYGKFVVATCRVGCWCTEKGRTLELSSNSSSERREYGKAVTTLLLSSFNNYIPRYVRRGRVVYTFLESRYMHSSLGFSSFKDIISTKPEEKDVDNK